MAQPTPPSSVSTSTKSIAVAHAQGQSADPPVFVGAIGTRQADFDKPIRRFQANARAGVCLRGPPVRLHPLSRPDPPVTSWRPP
jgi:hypothetical protein